MCACKRSLVLSASLVVSLSHSSWRWRVRENLRRRRHVERLDAVVRKAIHLLELLRVSARLDEQLETFRLATSRCGECGGLHAIIA